VKSMTLTEFFQKHSEVAMAFSGGVDSTYLLYNAIKLGAKVEVYYVKSPFQPQLDMDEAVEIGKSLNVRIKIIRINMLQEEKIVRNAEDRCYQCKSKMFEILLKTAAQDGFSMVVDGTNASDLEENRPGIRALRELGVRSPLRECGISKEEIRRFSKEAGLCTWNKPGYSCLATRIQTGEFITKEKLQRIEKAEQYLYLSGFSGYRVRMNGSIAKVELQEKQFIMAIERRKEILKELQQYFTSVYLDMEARDE